MTEETAYDWDTNTIPEPDEGPKFIDLPPGKYPFTVHNFKRGQHEESDKMKACPKAIITLAVDGGELGTAYVQHNLFLHKKCEGLMCAFFKGIGLRKKGEPLVLAWDKIVGCAGTVDLGTRLYEGKMYPDVKGFEEVPF